MTDDRTVQETDGWEVRARRVVLKTPVVTISAGPALCKRSGREKEFYSLDFPDWVNVIARTPDRQLVLIRQFRYGTERLEIEIPGGMINPGRIRLLPGVASCWRRQAMPDGMDGYWVRSVRILLSSVIPAIRSWWKRRCTWRRPPLTRWRISTVSFAARTRSGR